MTFATVSEVLTRAADLLDRGVCPGANARLANGKACGVFDQRAACYSMYGALCAVLGPSAGDDKALQASLAWRLISIRARAYLDHWDKEPSADIKRLLFALHDLNDDPVVKIPAAQFFREWADDPEIIAVGEWR